MNPEEFNSIKEKFLSRAKTVNRKLEKRGLGWLEAGGFAATGMTISEKEEHMSVFELKLSRDMSRVEFVKIKGVSLNIGGNASSPAMSQHIMKLISINKYIRQINEILTEILKEK